MLDKAGLAEKLMKVGVGRRKLDDGLFSADRAPARLGIYDEDDEDLSHEVASPCRVPGCVFTCGSLLQLEQHYDASHRYCCSECRRALPSPHLLDLHLQETHDSFFAVLAERTPSYCCYVQECTEKFKNSEERLEHCVKVHKLPKDFRFEAKPKGANKSKKKSKSQNVAVSMDVDAPIRSEKPQKFFFHNSKQKSLPKYSGKTFTSDQTNKSSTITSMDEVMSDLKDSLPN